MAKSGEAKATTTTKSGLERGAKANAIRAYRVAHPEAKTKEIAEAVTAQLGDAVTQGHVASVLGAKDGKKRKKELSVEDILKYVAKMHELGGLEEVKASLERVQGVLSLTDGDVGKAMEVVEMLLKYKDSLEPLMAKKEQAA